MVDFNHWMQKKQSKAGNHHIIISKIYNSLIMINLNKIMQ